MPAFAMTIRWPVPQTGWRRLIWRIGRWIERLGLRVQRRTEGL